MSTSFSTAIVLPTEPTTSWNGLVRLVDGVCVDLWHDCRGSPAAAACRSRIAAALERLRNALCGAGVPPFELALPAAPSFVAIENALWDITGHIAGNSEIVACFHALRSELRVFRDAAASCRHSSALNTCVFASSALSTCFFENTDADAESYASRSAPTSVTSVCAACGAVCTKKCARCKAVFYCSPACQRQHWTTGGHKTVCVAVAAGVLETGARAAAAAAPTPHLKTNASELAAVSAAAESLVAVSAAQPLASEVAAVTTAAEPAPFCPAPQPSNAAEEGDSVCGQPSPPPSPSNAAEVGDDAPSP